MYVHAEDAEPCCNIKGVPARHANPLPLHRAAEPTLHDLPSLS